MVQALSHVSWLAVLVAAVANFVLGGVWFAALFDKAYAAALGIADRPASKPSALMLAGPFVCSLFTIATTAVLLRALGVTTYGDAAGVGLVVGIGYLAAMTVNIAINPLFPAPFRYAAINVPYFVVGSVLSCLVLTAMQ